MTLSESLIGTWRLISRDDQLLDGTPRPEPTLGSDPLALLVYDRAGNFAAQFMKRDRSDVVAMPQQGGRASNNPTAIGGYDAYFGTYAVEGNLVTQQLLASMSPSDVGSVITREMHIVDGRLVIRIEMEAADGVPVVRTLRWERLA